MKSKCSIHNVQNRANFEQFIMKWVTFIYSKLIMIEMKVLLYRVKVIHDHRKPWVVQNQICAPVVMYTRHVYNAHSNVDAHKG